MSKLKLSTPNVQSFCQLAPFGGGANAANTSLMHVNGGALGIQANPPILNNVVNIEVENNHNLTITNSTIHIDVINLTSGTINLHNSYVSHGQNTDVVVGDNSTLKITGADICIGSLIVNSNSTLNFTHNGHNYVFQTPNSIDIIDPNAAVIVQNMDNLLTICEFINNKWVTDADFTLEETCYLRDYQKLDLNFVSLFMAQNGMVSTDTINHFINQNYFELTSITHDINLIGSTLQGAGSYNITEEICSWLNLKDVNLFGELSSDEV